jgi:hypothetical protein
MTYGEAQGLANGAAALALFFFVIVPIVFAVLRVLWLFQITDAITKKDEK